MVDVKQVNSVKVNETGTIHIHAHLLFVFKYPGFIKTIQ